MAPNHARQTAAESSADPDPTPLRQLAEIERGLRGSTAPFNVEVYPGPYDRSARVWFTTYEANVGGRESITGSLVTAVARSTAWEVSSVQDQREGVEDETEHPVVHSGVTLRAADDEGDA